MNLGLEIREETQEKRAGMFSTVGVVCPPPGSTDSKFVRFPGSFAHLYLLHSVSNLSHGNLEE